MLKSEQKHNAPALMSLFLPGLGQFVKGHIGKAFLIFFGIIFNLLLLFLLIGFLTMPLFWVWNVYDAYNKD